VRKLAFAAILPLLAGCGGSSAINQSYDVARVKRIGIASFAAPRRAVKGVEDVFAKYLIENGFTVIERSRLDAVLQEHKLSAQGVLSADTAKMLGQVLGVDAVFIGEITNYVPQKQSVAYVDTHNRYEQPVYEVRQEQQPDGSYLSVSRRTGTTVTEETVRTPHVYTQYAQIGVAIRLVDVETGEIIWVGSSTYEGENPLSAAESAASFLAGRFRKDCQASIKQRQKQQAARS